MYGGWGCSGRTVCEGFLTFGGEEGEGGCSEGKGFEHEEKKDEELHGVDGFKGGWKGVALTPQFCLISLTGGDDELVGQCWMLLLLQICRPSCGILPEMPLD